jgi:tryptophanase
VGRKADSIGHCNALFVDLRKALVKRLGWRFPAQCLARSAIERCGDRRERIGAMRAEVGALGEILAQQPIGVLVRAPLPRTLRVAEIDLDAGVDLQARSCAISAP